MAKAPKTKKEKPVYVRIGVSTENDALLDKLAEDGFKGALTKVDVGRILLQYALEADHYKAIMDWYRDRGVEIIGKK
jgi:hypothetical protein